MSDSDGSDGNPRKETVFQMAKEEPEAKEEGADAAAMQVDAGAVLAAAVPTDGETAGESASNGASTAQVAPTPVAEQLLWETQMETLPWEEIDGTGSLNKTRYQRDWGAFQDRMEDCRIERIDNFGEVEDPSGSGIRIARTFDDIKHSEDDQDNYSHRTTIQEPDEDQLLIGRDGFMALPIAVLMWVWSNGGPLHRVTRPVVFWKPPAPGTSNYLNLYGALKALAAGIAPIPSNVLYNIGLSTKPVPPTNKARADAAKAVAQSDSTHFGDSDSHRKASGHRTQGVSSRV